MSETLVKEITDCARCGESHANLMFKELSRPILTVKGNSLYTHWAPCPTSGEPILMKVVDDNYQFSEVAKVPKAEKVEKEAPPVDRTAVTTLHGTPVNELRVKQAKQKTGMHDDYIVLTEEERKKGFVRPVRTAYRHLKCGVVTRMNLALSETYARDPSFYGATYCAMCGTHFPVGENGEFVWEETDEKVGT